MTTGGPADESVDDLTQALSSDSSPHRGHPTDCSEVLGRVFFFLDNELEQADCAEIQHHLDECGPCLARYNLERTVKTLVARSCTEVAPEGLRQRVLLPLHQVQVEITRHD